MGKGLTHGDVDTTATSWMMTASLRTGLDPGGVFIAYPQKQEVLQQKTLQWSLTNQDQLPTHFSYLDRHVGDLPPLPTQIQSL